MTSKMNWTYHATIKGEIPPVIFDTANKMNLLWNELVAMHNRIPYQALKTVHYLERYTATPERLAELEAAAKAVKKASYKGFNPEPYLAIRTAIKAKLKAAADIKDTDPEQAKQLRAEAKALRAEIFALPSSDIPLEQRINDHVQERGNELGLPVWCKWHVGDNFKLAMEAFASGKRKPPRFKPRFADRIHIENRTDSGTGWTVEQLFKKRTAFSLKPERLNDGRYEGWLADGWFTVGGVRVPIAVTMHRPLPDGAIIKRFSLIGECEKASRQWEWKVLFNIEIPDPIQVVYPQTGAAIAIDAGWRSARLTAYQEAGIRVMTLFDGFKYQEIVIPYDLSNRRERRAEYADRPRIDIREVWEITRQRDAELEKCKAAIRAMDKTGWPTEARRTVNGLTKMRSAGLMRLRKALANHGIICQPIEDWRAFDIPAWEDQRHIERRWYGSRDALYRQIAAELADRADTIIWEGDLKLKDIADKPAKNKAKRKKKHAETGEWESRTERERIEEAAAKWRQLASLYRFRMWIKEEIAQKGRTLVDEPAAYSSQICAECGAAIEPSPELIVKCANGHIYDQDVNSARYFWNRLDEDLRAVAAPAASVRRSQISRLFRDINP